jgi:glutamine amidotransferase-like uncharacterized protein
MLWFSLAMAALASSTMASTRPKALVYRGPAACDGCPEAVAHLLKTSSSNFDVTYVGPEDTNITAEVLKSADIFAQPGGGGVSKTWPHMKPYRSLIRDFVDEGGVYLGFCLGAYFAGSPGYQLLPKGDNTNEECTQPGAEVKDLKNTIIQVDWHFSTGAKDGTTEKRWIFFQDGAVMEVGKNMTGVEVLGNYARNQDVAATLNPFGKGVVACTGPHPEATEDWCKLWVSDGIFVRSMLTKCCRYAVQTAQSGWHQFGYWV